MKEINNMYFKGFEPTIQFDYKNVGENSKEGTIRKLIVVIKSLYGLIHIIIVVNQNLSSL